MRSVSDWCQLNETEKEQVRAGGCCRALWMLLKIIVMK